MEKKIKFQSGNSYDSFNNFSSRSSHKTITTSFYMNSFNEVHLLISKISSIDCESMKLFSKNDEFRSFIKYSLDIFEQESKFHQVKLERILLDDCDELKFRMTFYIPSKKFISFFEEKKYVPERIVYKNLLRNLFTRNKELRKLIVIDERVL